MDPITLVLLVLVAAFALGNILLYFTTPSRAPRIPQPQGRTGTELASSMEALQQKLELVNTRLYKIEAMISLAGRPRKGQARKKRAQKRRA